MTEWSLAVDIGGTKMAAGLVDRSGTLLHRAQVPTPPSKLSETVGVSQDGEHLWSTLSALVSGVCAQLPDGDRIVVCGVGCGGPMSKGGDTVSPLNIGGWRAFPLRARLSELVGVSAFVDNDAKALALGEGWIGAAAGLDDYIAMVVSTGVGGGVVLDGRLLNGLSGMPGTSATWSWCRMAARASAAAKGAWKPKLRERPSRPSRVNRRSWHPTTSKCGPAPWWGWPSRPWSTCSIYR
jgi:glucokinase